MKCEYCDGNELYKTINYESHTCRNAMFKLSLDIGRDNSGDGRESMVLSTDFSVDGSIISIVETPINFCPFCGRYLHGEIPVNKGLTYDITDMELSVRAYNALRRVGIHTVSDICERDEYELKSIRNLGPKAFQEVEYILYCKYGLRIKDRADSYIPQKPTGWNK